MASTDDEDEQLQLALAESREVANESEKAIREEQKQLELAIQASLRDSKPPKDQALTKKTTLPLRQNKPATPGSSNTRKRKLPQVEQKTKFNPWKNPNAGAQSSGLNKNQHGVKLSKESEAAKISPLAPKAETPRTNPNATAAKRIAKEFAKFNNTYKSDDPKSQFTLSIDETDMHVCSIAVNWIAKCRLQQQLDVIKAKIKLEFTFPPDYPFRPPFVRVVEPVLYDGNVHRGGAICLEFLTTDKWCASWSLESTVVQVITALTNENRGTYVVHNPSQYWQNSKRTATESFAKINKTKPWWNYPGDTKS